MARMRLESVKHGHIQMACAGHHTFFNDSHEGKFYYNTFFVEHPKIADWLRDINAGYSIATVRACVGDRPDVDFYIEFDDPSHLLLFKLTWG